MDARPEESMEMQWLRRQLGESQAQLMAVQAQFDAYLMSAQSSGGFKDDPNSPQMVRPPMAPPTGLPILVESPDSEEAKHR